MRDPGARLDRSGSAGWHLDVRGVWSAVGVARLCQLTLSCAAVALLVHGAGPEGGDGRFYLAVWASTFSLTASVLVLDVTRLRACLPVCWAELTVAWAALAGLLTLVASVLYPASFLRAAVCPDRVAVCACSGGACLSYAAEVFLSRPRPGQVPAYMATPPGLLKVAQSCVACGIFVWLPADRDLSPRGPLIGCVVAWGVGLGVTLLLVVVVVVAGRPPPPRLLLVPAVMGVVLHLAAAALWPAFSLHARHGCSKCSWEAKMAVSALCWANLLLYGADLVFTWRLARH